MGADCVGGSTKAVDIYILAVGFVLSRRPSDIDIIHEGCCNVGHLILYDEINIPLQDWTEFVAPIGRVVRCNKRGHLEGCKVPRFNSQASVVKGHE